MESANTVAPIVATGKALLPAWLPEGLSASVGVGVTLGAMMGDQSLRKRWGDEVLGRRVSLVLRRGSRRQFARSSFRAAAPAHRACHRVATRSRCARACWPARRSPCCDWCAAWSGERPLHAAHRRSAGLRAPALAARSTAARAVGEQHPQVAVAALGDASQSAAWLPEECSLGVRPNQAAK